MGRQCCFPGCKQTSGLHNFPADPEMRRRWWRALRLPERDLPPRAGVCNLHFSRDCFSNLMEVDMGFSKVPLLKSNAVPTTVAPALQLQLLTAPQRPQNYVLVQPKLTREIGCQTEPVSTKHAAGQADVKPNRRSQATQARTPNRSVSCDTGTFVAFPEALAIPEVPSASSTSVKRTRCEVTADDSSYKLDVTDSTTNYASTSDELPPHTVTKYAVHEDKLMELFKRCPVCTRSCVISKTVTGTLLQVRQICPHCEYCYQWCSQPMVNESS